MQKLFHAMVVLTTAMVIACAALLGWALFLEKPFLTYENLPFPPQIQKVRPGEVMPLVVRRCNSASSVRFYDVTHELRRVDRPEPPRIMKGERVKIDPGCRQGLSTVNEVPLDTPPGVYIAAGLGIVEGTVRTFAVPWYSQPFEVTP